MELFHVTFHGPGVDDLETLECVPPALRGLLSQINGFIQFHGGLHVRGACREPHWHSLREAWHGSSAYRFTYPTIDRDDIPFAQDCVGDQFFLRDDRVVRLYAETGEVVALGLDLRGFFSAVERNPIEFLGLQPLMRLQTEGGTLEPGQLLSVYPPFCTHEAVSGVSVRAVPAQERLSFLADFYRKGSSSESVLNHDVV